MYRFAQCMEMEIWKMRWYKAMVFPSDFFFSFTHEWYIFWDVYGLRSPSFENSSGLYSQIAKINIDWTPGTYALLGLDELTQVKNFYMPAAYTPLTHLPLVLHICVSKLGQHWFRYVFLPVRCQAIIWTNAGLLSIEPLGTNFSEILIKIQNSSFMKMYRKTSFAKWRTFSLGDDALMDHSECSV